MIRGFDLTVYEILGYLLPGVITFAACVFAAGLLVPQVLELHRWATLGWWIVLPLTISYVLGHAMQALANSVFGDRAENAALEATLRDLPMPCLEAVAERFRIADVATAIADWQKPAREAASKLRGFYCLCVELLEQHAKTTTRDVFLYREGFYRGTCLSLTVLALGCLAWLPRLWRYGRPLREQQAFVVAVAILVLTVLVAEAFRRRYKRFATYRVRACVWGAATVATAGRMSSRPSHDMD